MAADSLDLDSQTKPWSSGATNQSVLKEIAIACEAELTRTQIYPRTERVIRRILALAEAGMLNHG